MILIYFELKKVEKKLVSCVYFKLIAQYLILLEFNSFASIINATTIS